MRVRKTALVFAAHGDDETNGCAGTLFLLKEHNWATTIVYATSPGERESECRRAAGYLGARCEFWHQPDGSLEDKAETRKMATDVYERVQPELVLVMSGHDVHPDHRAMNSIALGPALQRGSNVEVMLYELCSSGRHTNGDRPQTLGFYPTHLVNTQETVAWEYVAEMTRCHQSQDPEAMITGMMNVHENRARDAGINWTYERYAGAEPTPPQAEAFVRLTRAGPLQHELDQIFKPTNLAEERGIGCDFDPVNIGIGV